MHMFLATNLRLSFIFLLLSLLVSDIQAIQCYACSSTQPVAVSLPMTAEQLDGLTPPQCETTLKPSNSSIECAFKLWINSERGRGQSSAVNWTNTVNLDLVGSDRSTSARQEERIELRMKSTQTEHRNSRNDFIYYYCFTNRCNTLENMKRVLAATLSDFDFDRIMTHLAANRTVTIHEPLPYDSYIENGMPSITEPFCFPCHSPVNNSHSSTCIKAEARTCGGYVCGACYWAIPVEQNILAEFDHLKIYWLNNRSSTSSFWYTCTLPNCNTEKKQEEVRLLYTLDFDLEKFAGEPVTSTTVDSSNTAAASLRGEIVMVIGVVVHLCFHSARLTSKCD